MGKPRMTISCARASQLPTVGILSIFRDESQLIGEWLRHYLAEGVSQYVLIDSESTDSSVDVINFFASHHRRCVQVDLLSLNGSHNQLNAYNMFAHVLRTDWALVVDVDEWVYARLQYHTIPEFLQSLPASAGLVILPWKRFGSSGVVASPISAIASYVRREIIAGDDPASDTYNVSLTSGWLSGKIYNFKSLFRIQAAKHARDTVLSRPSSVNASGCHPSNLHTVACHASWIISHQHRAFLEQAPALLPDGHELPRSLDRVRWVGPLRSMASFGLHLNHYMLGSCEYYAKVRPSCPISAIYRNGLIWDTQSPQMLVSQVKMTRGDVVSREKDRVRTWTYFREWDGLLNEVEDNELRLK